jgi:hypothetical protein
MTKRLLDWLGGIGIILSTLIAIGVAVYTIQHPVPGFPSSSWDRLWALIYAGLFLLSVGIFWHKSGATLLVVAVILTSILLLLPLFSPDTVLSMLAWFVLLYLFSGLGAFILGRFFPEINIPLLDRWAVSMLMGIGALAFMTLILGVVGLYYRAVAWGVALVLGLFIWKTWRRALGEPTLHWFQEKAHSLGKKNYRWAALAIAFLLICLAGTYLWALTPAIRYDALSYHLAVPDIFIRNHKMVEIPESFNTYWAHYADMLYTLAMLLTGQPLPGLLHFSAALLSAAFVFALTRRLSSARPAWIAAILFCSIPIISIQAGTPYIDLFVTVFVIGAVYAGVSWQHSRENSWLALSGGFAGLAMGAKLAALPVLIPFAVLLVIGILRLERGWKNILRSLAWWALPAGLLLFPWLLRDWLWTGNPIFPMMNGVFQSPKWAAQSDVFSFSPMKRIPFTDYLLLPWILVTRAAKYYHESPGAVLAGVPLLALPWSYWRRDKDKPGLGMTAVLLWLTCLAGAVLTFFSAPNIRYLMPLLAIFSCLAALNVEPFLKKWNSWKKILVILALALVVCYLYTTRLTTLIHIPQYLPRLPAAVALGFADRQEFLSENINVYQALQYLSNREPAPKVLSLGNEFRYPTTARIYGIVFSNEVRQILAGNPDSETLSKRLAEAGYDYILINEPEMATSGLYKPGYVVTPEFLRRYAHLEFTHNQVDVYRFDPQGVDLPFRSPNLLANPGFERLDADELPLSWGHAGVPLVDRSGNQAKSGSVAVLLHGSLPQEQYAYLFQNLSAQPGQIYTFAQWVRPDPSASEYVAVQVAWLDANGQELDADGVWQKLQDDWQRYAIHVQAPPQAAGVRVYLLVTGAQAAWFDDICFAAGDSCP